MVHFSWLTILLLALGWLSHWLMSVRKAKAAARAAKCSEPSLFSYWWADPETTMLSIIGVVVLYFVVPSLALRWPEVALIIGATKDDPMAPIAAYLSGLAAPYFADWAGKRTAKMVGDE